MREILKKGYYTLQKILRKDVRLLKNIQRENFVTVLNLHQVSPHENPFWSPLKPEVFESLVSYLNENFEVVLFHQLREIRSKKPLAVLSFDDGYYNFIEYALPILEKYGLRVNMNVIPECAENEKPIWNVRLYDFLNSAPKSLINEIRLTGFEGRLTVENPTAKLRYGLAISRFLKNRPRRERDELLDEIEKTMSRIDFPLTRMMNAKEIRQIAKDHEIGVHSFTHESMEFEEDSFFEEDLGKCFAYFREKLQLPLEIYAFPNGSYRDKQIEILRNNGVKYTLLVGEDYSLAKTDVFHRFTIYGAEKLETKFQALGINRKGS